MQNNNTENEDDIDNNEGAAFFMIGRLNNIKNQEIKNYNNKQIDQNKSKFMDQSKFYDQALDHGEEGRKTSRIIYLRQFDNWIKAVQINKHIEKLGKTNISVFDICCGKGGDLKKYLFNNVKLYIGADNSLESLKNAMDRVNKIKVEKFHNKELGTKIIFIHEDVSYKNNELLEKIDKNYYFDLVSCQFALHYHFSAEENLRAFLKNVSSRLCEGGFFICTIINDNTLMKRLKDNYQKYNKLEIIDEVYAFKFDNNNNFSNKKDGFGIEYGCFLEDSIGKFSKEDGYTFVGEYLIVFPILKRICEEYNLILYEKDNFHDFYNKYKTKYKDMFDKIMSLPDNYNINDIQIKKDIISQWQYAHLFMAVSFRKVASGKSLNYYEDKVYVPYLKQKGNIINDYKPELIEKKFD